jgi:hypothetical protein
MRVVFRPVQFGNRTVQFSSTVIGVAAAGSGCVAIKNREPSRAAT